MLQQNRYFGSYNTAFDPVIRNVSGVDLEEQQMGPFFNYYDTPRAQIFARANGSINRYILVVYIHGMVAVG